MLRAAPSPKCCTAAALKCPEPCPEATLADVNLIRSCCEAALQVPGSCREAALLLPFSLLSLGPFCSIGRALNGGIGQGAEAPQAQPA